MGTSRFGRRTASALLYNRFVLLSIPQAQNVLVSREQPRILINDCLVHSGGRGGQAKRSLEEMDEKLEESFEVGQMSFSFDQILIRSRDPEAESGAPACPVQIYR